MPRNPITRLLARFRADTSDPDQPGAENIRLRDELRQVKAALAQKTLDRDAAVDDPKVIAERIAQAQEVEAHQQRMGSDAAMETIAPGFVHVDGIRGAPADQHSLGQWSVDLQEYVADPASQPDPASTYAGRFDDVDYFADGRDQDGDADGS